METVLIANKRIGFEIRILSLTILFYLSRTAIPFLKFPFVLIYSGLFIYTVWRFKRELIGKIIEFSRIYALFIFLAVILIGSFLFSDKFYLTIFKDIFNSIILLSFFLLLTAFIDQKSDLISFIRIFLNLLIIFAIVISVNEIVTLLNINSFVEYQSTAIANNGQTYELITHDNNFALLIVFFGFISIIYVLQSTKLKIRIIFYNVILLLFSFNICLSGSRRGIIIFLIIIGLLIVNHLISLFKKKSVYKRISTVTIYFLVFLVLTSGILWSYTKYTSSVFKNRMLTFIGCKNPDAVRRAVTFTVLKYTSAVYKNSTYADIYRTIWTPNLNPFDPDSGWGTRIHKTIFPLSGQNVEIVPSGSKGYLMDRSCNSDPRSGNAYSYTTISNEVVNEGKSLEASVYCFVSEDYDGEFALISCEGATIGKTVCEYDLQFKGKWQKLSLKVNCTNGTAPVYLYFSKFGVKDFSTLKGYVIFAYPDVEIKEKKNSISVSPDVFDLNRIEHAVMIPPLHFNTNEQTIDRDPLRNWLKNLFSEDTVYHGYSKNLVVNGSSNEFIGARYVRWKFAWQIYTKEFNPRQKVFGGGFNFLNWFGYYFLKDKTLSDYPHNPFLSILLYSGIVGLVLYILLLFKVFNYYLKYIKEYYLFFIFFLITFFFSFFSAGSPFDPPLMGFFMLLPFFIHSIHNNDIPSKPVTLTDAKNSHNRDK
jgi:hypothetical protein